MADSTGVVTKAAVTDAWGEPERVFVWQQFNAEARAAQSKERLLDAPKVTLEDAWQREELFGPVPTDRITMHEAKPSVESRL